jgi:UDP-glucose 4-epimerase
VGTGKALKIRDLAQIMITIFNLDLVPVFAEPRRGDIINSLADISRLKIVLGFGPSRKIEPALKQMFKSSD